MPITVMRDFSAVRTALALVLPLALATALPACGGASASASGSSDPVSGSASKDAKELHAAVMKKLDEAKAALTSSGPLRARELATEARHMAGQSDLYAVLGVLSLIDTHEAKELTQEAKQLAGGQKCKDALETIASAIRKSQSKAFIEELRTSTEEALVECVRKDVDVAIENGEFAQARALIEQPGAAVALGDDAWKELYEKLRDGIIARLSSKMDADLNAGRFAEAVAKIDAAVQKGDVGPDEQEHALESIRKIVAPRQLAAMKAAIGSNTNPGAPLATLDDLVRLLKWKQLPPDLAQARKALSVWVEVSKLHAAPVSKPSLRWTYGKVELHRADDSDSDSTALVASAKKAWVLATAPGLSLVSLDEPPADLGLEDRMLVADGWVGTRALQSVDTIDWLLPGDQIVGQRVFGPFGREKSDKGYYLGVATEADGANVKVRRLMDEQVVTVPRGSLRSGRVVPGLKVLTTCTSQLKLEEAKIEKEMPQTKGISLVRVVCPTTGPKDDVLGAVITKPEWLPARRP